MADSNYRLIGSIKQGEGSDTLGYAVVDLTTNKAVFRSINELMVLVRSGMTLQNAIFDSSVGDFKGTDGSINRLPIFSTDGKVLSNPTVTVLGEYKQGESSLGYYKVMDTYGRTTTCSKEILIGYLGKMDGTNAKLVDRNGVLIVSAILGSFTALQIQVPVKGDKEFVGEQARQDFMKTSSVSDMESEMIKNKKTLADVKIKTKQFRSGIVGRIIGYGVRPYNVEAHQSLARCRSSVGSVKDIVGNLAYKYNQTIDIKSYLYTSSSYSAEYAVTSSRESYIKSWYSVAEDRIVREKKLYNRQVGKYNELRNFDFSDLSDRKENGDWLSSAEFSYYLRIKNGETHAGILTTLSSKIKNTKRQIEDMEKGMLAGRRVHKGMGVSSSVKLLSKEDILAFEPPFLKEYLLRGKLDFTLDTLREEKELLGVFNSRRELIKNLDVLFVIAVKKACNDCNRSGQKEVALLREVDAYLTRNKWAVADSVALLGKYL